MQKTRFFQLNKPQLSDFANIEEAINPSMDYIKSAPPHLVSSHITPISQISQFSHHMF